MKRKIIKINEEKCNGCGLCINICAEAALKLVDGKAKLVRDFYCDGMGACLDVCPEDALKIVEEEAEEYDPEKTHEHVKKERGEEAAKNVHGIKESNTQGGIGFQDEPMACGCPGTMMRDMRNDVRAGSPDSRDNEDEQNTDVESRVRHRAPASELRQWPIQLHLITPQAPYFKDADLVITADCVPFAYADFHRRFLRGKALIMFCPKLDADQDIYVDKLVELFKTQNIKSISIIHMIVPCCSGVGQIVEQALEKSGKNIIMKDYTISLEGEIV